MPHSGGGGSHGGGSHGGPHGSHGGSGGSRARTSHTYFPGSKRYRKHYHNGRDDEYFYSDVPPRKNGLSGVILTLVMGIFFSGAILFTTGVKIPMKLHEKYDRPQTRVIDNIDIIDDTADLEAALEEYNDITGICPVVYTMYTEDDYPGYNQLVNYAYDRYCELFDDEQHYLIVYAIPKDQKEPFMEGTLNVPDYEWEIMVGDKTDALYNDSVFVPSVQSGLEAGKKPEEVFASSIRELGQYDKNKLSKPFSNIYAFIPALFVFGLFFLIPAVRMFITYLKERMFDYEEMPLDHSDESKSSTAGVGTSQNSSAMKFSSIFVLIFLIPFFCIGIGTLIRAVTGLTSGASQSMPLLFFALMWNTILCFAAFRIITSLKQSGASILPKKTPEEDDYRSVQENTSSQQYDYDPVYDYNRFPSHDDCKADHYDDDDNSLKGYE